MNSIIVKFSGVFMMQFSARGQNWKSGKWKLPHDNIVAHSLHFAPDEILIGLSWNSSALPGPFSPDMAPCDAW